MVAGFAKSVTSAALWRALRRSHRTQHLELATYVPCNVIRFGNTHAVSLFAPPPWLAPLLRWCSPPYPFFGVAVRDTVSCTKKRRVPWALAIE